MGIMLSLISHVTVAGVSDIISNVMEAIETWFKGLLAGGIISSMSTTNNLLSSALNDVSVDSDTGEQTVNGISSIFSEYLSGDITSFGASTVWEHGVEVTTNNAVWDAVKSVSEAAIVPIAGTILALVMCYELYDIIINSNNFHDTDTSFFVRWIIKCLCGITLVSNVFSIASWFLQFGTDATSTALDELLGSGGLISATVLSSGDTLKQTLINNYDVGELLITLIISFLMIIGAFIVLAAIIVVLAQRIIEAMMYLSIAPIPVATSLNRDWGEMGKNWLRNLTAIGFQGFFIVIALAIFKRLFQNSMVNMMTGDDIVMSMCTTFGFLIAMIFTIMRTSQISKSAFGAH